MVKKTSGKRKTSGKSKLRFNKSEVSLFVAQDLAKCFFLVLRLDHADDVCISIKLFLDEGLRN